jgi:aminopeptidase N
MKKIFLFLFLAVISLPLLFAQMEKYDVKEYILDLNISNTSTEISGSAITNALVVTSVLDTFAIELINTIVPNQTYMIVDSVFVDGTKHDFIHSDEIVVVPLQQVILQNVMFSVQIYYHGNGTPCTQTDGNGIAKYTYSGVTSTVTYSEPLSSKVWWPCKQDLTDKADSLTFFITTDATNKTGSNGLLISTENLPNGKVKYKWKSKYPIAYFLVSFCVGNYEEHITDVTLPNEEKPMLIQSLLFPNSPLYSIHLTAIEKTKNLLCLYSNLINVYPFKNEKYGYCVAGHPLGAMEHQTMTTIGYQAMDTTSNSYYSYYYWYVAHELAHQWFGDYVTCAKWNDIWLKEGWASYFEYIALQNLESQTKANSWMNNAHNSVKSKPGGSVYNPDPNSPDIFDYRLAYKKGGAVAHILRYEVNDDALFFNILRNYMTTYANSSASVADFKEIAEITTGKDFTDFFNQWVYGEGYPTFTLKWSQQEDTLFVASEQTTSTTTTPLFKTDFDLKINYLSGNDTIIRLYQGANTESYSIVVPEIVKSIQFDPNIWLINKNSIAFVGVDEYSYTDLSCVVFPNPAVNNINIIIDEDDIKNTVATLYGIQGKLVLQQALNQAHTDLNLSKLQRGIYILELKNGNKIKSVKIRKE